MPCRRPGSSTCWSRRPLEPAARPGLEGPLRDRTRGPRPAASGCRRCRAAVRYDRLTGYFDASALALAARGVEELIRNSGRMRLIVGCTLGEAEVAAIEKGASLADTVTAPPLLPETSTEQSALELLAWMVQTGRAAGEGGGALQPRDTQAAGRHRRLPPEGRRRRGQGRRSDRLLRQHQRDATRLDREWRSRSTSSEAGPRKNTCSPRRTAIARLWDDLDPDAIVVDVPTALAQDLLRFLPEDDKPPRRLDKEEPEFAEGKPRADGRAGRASSSAADRSTPADLVLDRQRRHAARPCRRAGRRGDVDRNPWPHQVRAFERMYRSWPPRLLIADEVGLGKTIQAGLLIRQAWLAGRAKRILVMAPKAVLRQWQIELREKFALSGRSTTGSACPGTRPRAATASWSGRSRVRTGTRSPACWYPPTCSAVATAFRRCSRPSPGTSSSSTRPTTPGVPAPSPTTTARTACSP